MSAAAVASRVREVREALGISREKLVRRTDTVSIGTLRNAEVGRRITHENARQITQAVNSYLAERMQNQIGMEDLGLLIY